MIQPLFYYMNDINARKKNIELLSPAGNMDGLVGAINAGCNAVYLGGSKFGARAYAENFSDEEVVYAIKYAHLFGVKVYLTINTLVKEREFDEAVEFVRPFCEAGLDAFIIQDMGLAERFKNIYPNTELHISTQSFITGSLSAKFYKNMGATRVVLAREMTLEEIKEIKSSVDIELETFIHGAMCYSYSGQCLFSSAFGGRSGNRGRCAGPCRQMYAASFNDNNYPDCYVLSMKDQCTLEILPKLIDAGIDSFKIEGRMKKPEYSAFVTSVYRKYIDLYLSGEDYVVDKKDIQMLKRVYLRSDIGTGYYEKTKGKDMITLSNPAYDLTDDSTLLSIREKYIEKPRKAEISGYFVAVKNSPVYLTLVIGDKSVTVEGDYAQIANNRATTKEEVEKNISKLGGTPFVFDELNIEMDSDLFIPVSKINELRRRAVEELMNEL